jgi:extradiol dioxygenase family protein
MSNKIQPFHLAVPVNDLSSTRNFYGELLGMEEGRSCDHWIDWNFFGHQFVTHLNQEKTAQKTWKICGCVDPPHTPGHPAYYLNILGWISLLIRAG